MKTRFCKLELSISRKQKKEIKKKILNKVGCTTSDLEKIEIGNGFVVFSNEKHFNPLEIFESVFENPTTNYLFDSIEINTQKIFFLVDIDNTLSISGIETIMPNTEIKRIYVSSQKKAMVW